nr:LysM peptidoglycan-binding domain-containing protein [Microbacterium mitrae]
MATRLRITERGRRVLAALVALPIVVAVVIAVLSGGTALASLDEGGAPVTFETINVMPGDTLWSLAGEIAPAADPRDVIDAIVSLNALPSSAIVPGQTLSIPAEYTK